MKVEQVLHMNAGNHDMSYSKNSAFQNRLLIITQSVRQSAIMEAYKSTSFPKTMSIGDLGCASGPNTLLVASDAIDAVELVCKELNRKPLSEIHILFNDLPGNDFSGLINSLEDFQKSHHCFISVVPGSFYGRLFPSQTLHFIHSSSCLHWLSQVPPELQSGSKVKLNKGNIYISKTSPPCVLEAYSEQFQKDFSMFLKSRAEEIFKGGCMELTFVGRRKGDEHSYTTGVFHMWGLLAQALMDMASQGVVEMEKIDSFNLPFYSPSLEEVNHAIEGEGSFTIKSIEIFDTEWDVDHSGKVYEENASMSLKLSTGQQMAKYVRACVESMFASHFGEEILDDLFLRYTNLLEDLFIKINATQTHFNVCLQSNIY